jgi:hypothetical protein
MSLTTKVSESGHFIVIDGLHIDRSVFDALAAWAEPKGLPVQDAIQLAIIFFTDAKRNEN